MTRKKSVSGLAAVASISMSVVLLTSCSTATESPAVESPPVVVEEAEETPTPEVAPEPQVVVPAVGEPVSADQVEAVREAGGNVYVSPRSDGSGIVIDPAAPIPQVVYDDLWITSQAAPTDEQIAADTTILDHELRVAVQDAVIAANLRLFLVFPQISVNDPANNYVTYRSGYAGGYLSADAQELNPALQDALVEGVPTGQARLEHSDAIRVSPEAWIAASQPFLDAHPAQVVILD